MTKIKIVEFFGENTFHFVGFRKKIGIIWVSGQKMVKLMFWGLLYFGWLKTSTLFAYSF